MKAYNELVGMTKAERFKYVLSYVISNMPTAFHYEVMQRALLGNQNNDVRNWDEALIISKLVTNDFIGWQQADCVADLMEVSK